MNQQKLREDALRYHETPIPGKIEILPTKPYKSAADLALAYSPGVAYPCTEIANNPDDVWRYTGIGNLVAVISNGTAVLGLGNIGAHAAKPVMEGKSFLFKVFAGINAYDIELDTENVDDFVNAVKAISPTFGGINLEDIKAPECFEIEARLRDECDIPVMHDDQHGTAIIVGAAMINALKLQNKKIEDVRMVVNGAGAAAMACTDMLISLGMRRDNIIMCDSKGVISTSRANISGRKRLYAADTDAKTLADAMVGADVFLGLSVADVLTANDLRVMADRPIVFALANPDPEIAYDKALAARKDIIFATGRSDYPNQINNVLGFPYIFRGALDCHATAINEAMKHAAVHAIAYLAREPVPDTVRAAYAQDRTLEFGPDYIIPTPFDPRLLTTVSPAVARAAADSGVARKPIDDYERYAARLDDMMHHENEVFNCVTGHINHKVCHI